MGLEAIIKTVLYFFGTAMALATLLPILRHDAWWIRIFDFPRLQILVIGALVFVMFVAAGYAKDPAGIVFSVLLGVALLYQAHMMFPYTPLADKQVQDSFSAEQDATVRILFANVLMTNRRTAALMEILKRADPDLVLLVEVDEWWCEQMASLECTYPFAVKYPLPNTYGMVLYSRLQLVNPAVRFLVQEDVPSIHGRMVLRSGHQVEFRCLHPRPPVPHEQVSALPRDAEILIVGKENRRDDTPFVVFGDLNDVAWSRTNYLFQDISGLLDPRVGRGFYPTFHTKIPFLKFPLDHFFHSAHFRLVEFRRLPYFGSDHYPVLIELSLEPDAAQEQDILSPEIDEVFETEEKIAAAISGENL